MNGLFLPRFSRFFVHHPRHEALWPWNSALMTPEAIYDPEYFREWLSVRVNWKRELHLSVWAGVVAASRLEVNRGENGTFRNMFFMLAALNGALFVCGIRSHCEHSVIQLIFKCACDERRLHKITKTVVLMIMNFAKEKIAPHCFSFIEVLWVALNANLCGKLIFIRGILRWRCRRKTSLFTQALR